MNACHWLDRAWYSHRYREDNVFGWCVSCNKYHAQAHWSSLENLQTRRYWIEWVDKQYRERNKIPPTIEELVQIINRYS